MLLNQSLRDRIVAADPGLTRLYMAARATASVGTALGILEAAARLFQLPVGVPLLGAALCITWSISVNDADPRDQRITTLLLWIPAALFVTIGTITAPARILSDVLFLAVLFFAVYVRRYGPRANAAGLISVLSFFFTLFLRADVRMLPWLILALAVSALCTYVFRFAVFRDRPEVALQNALEAFRARQRLIEATIDQARVKREWSDRLKLQLDHHLYRLNETALAIDDLLSDPGQDALRGQVLDAELEIGSLVERALNDPAEAVHFPAFGVAPSELRAQGWTPRGAFRVGTQIQTPWLQPSTRQALQLTIGAAAAMIAGELLSTQRWYWAVLTTFLVFSGVSSTGEALVKGWSRVLGTGLGIAAGAGVAELVRGHDVAAFLLLFVFLFAGVYAIRLSYAVFTFFLTALLSMLYVLLGAFTNGLLVLRLVETVIGAACGGIAAMVLLPIRTRDVLGNVSAEALERLADAIEKSIRRMQGDIGADALVAARSYDEAMQSVRSQLEPLMNTARFGARERFHSRLALYSMLGRYARGLAVCAYEPDNVVTDDVRWAADATETHIRELVRLVKTGNGEIGPAIEKPPKDDAALTYLYRTDRAIHRLAAFVRGTAE